MATPSPLLSSFSSISIPLFSAFVGGALVLLFFADYFRCKLAEAAISSPEPKPSSAAAQKSSKTPSSSNRKSHTRYHAHGADKDQNKKQHHVDANTLKGHGDCVTALCFSSNGRNLVTNLMC